MILLFGGNVLGIGMMILRFRPSLDEVSETSLPWQWGRYLLYITIYIYCAFLMRLLGFENMGFCVPNGETLNWNNWNDHPG